MRSPLVVACVVSLSAVRLPAQTCDSPHYRWAQKTTVALRDSTPHPVMVDSILRWPALPLFHDRPGQHDCTERSARERNVYEITGWVRTWKIEKGTADKPGDLDWHVELTQGDTTDPLDCIVVEIPDPRYGVVFDSARHDFLVLLGASKPKKNGTVDPPVRLTFVGAAFFDGQHRGGKKSNRPPEGHGHCNSSTSALWELHPVYAVHAAEPR